MPIIVEPELTPGAGLDLCAVFLNTASNLADLQGFEYVGDSLSPTTTARVEVRQLVNRRRLIRRSTISGATTTERYTLNLPRCDSSQVSWLRAQVGVLLCIRDHKGAKFYGVYTEVPREIATGFPDRTQVRITIDEVTHSEAV